MMKISRSSMIIKVCVHVVFLSVLFWVGCQNVAYAQGLVTNCVDPMTDCGWNELIDVAINIIDFIILMAAPLAALAFLYAGFLYLTAAGNEGQIKRAHTVFTKVLIGFIIVLAAWLIVSTILNFFAPATSLLG